MPKDREKTFHRIQHKEKCRTEKRRMSETNIAVRNLGGVVPNVSEPLHSDLHDVENLVAGDGGIDGASETFSEHFFHEDVLSSNFEDNL